MGYLYRGIAKIGNMDHTGAMADINLALEINPKFIAAYYSRGLLKIELGQKESGFSDLNKASELGDIDLYEGISENYN